MTVRCPVCWRAVPASFIGVVWRHRDKASHSCPMGGHIYPIDDQEEAA